MAKRHKPTDPAKLMEQRLERQARDREIARLEAQGVTVTVDPARRIVSAYRSNAFNLLLQRGTITANHHDAACRLVESWAAWKGMDGKPEQGAGKVDKSTQPQPLVSDRMIRGGKEVSQAMESIDAHARRLLNAFMVATVEEDRPMHWRGIVQRITGEDRERHQVGLFVAMVDQLAAHYQAPREARAA